MADLTIRACERADSVALARLFNQASYRHGTMRMPYETASEVEARLFGAANPNALDLVALMDGAIVGFGRLSRSSGRRGHVANVGIGIDEGRRRQGIGRALMTALIDHADNWLGLRRLELGVNVDNPGAVALYESLGFEIEGRERQSILRDGVLVDSFIMARLRAAPEPMPSN